MESQDRVDCQLWFTHSCTIIPSILYAKTRVFLAQLFRSSSSLTLTTLSLFTSHSGQKDTLDEFQGLDHHRKLQLSILKCFTKIFFGGKFSFKTLRML